MLGRGDVGKVYLVREKKTGKLFAMKGSIASFIPLNHTDVCDPSLIQEGDD